MVAFSFLPWEADLHLLLDQLYGQRKFTEEEDLMFITTNKKTKMFITTQ